MILSAIIAFSFNLKSCKKFSSFLSKKIYFKNILRIPTEERQKLMLYDGRTSKMSFPMEKLLAESKNNVYFDLFDDKLLIT